MSTKETEALARQPEVAEALGLILRMMHDRSYGSVTVKIQRGRVETVEQTKTFKPQHK